MEGDINVRSIVLVKLYAGYMPLPHVAFIASIGGDGGRLCEVDSTSSRVAIQFLHPTFKPLQKIYFILWPWFHDGNVGRDLFEIYVLDDWLDDVDFHDEP
jgi:hypothetical protein